jgi:hypothetical protein
MQLVLIILTKRKEMIRYCESFGYSGTSTLTHRFYYSNGVSVPAEDGYSKSLMDQWYIRTHCIPIMGISLTFPSWSIGIFIPTATSYKLSTNNQTFISRKEAYTSPKNSTETTNNKISPSTTK